MEGELSVNYTLKQKITMAFLISSIIVLGMMFSVTQYIIQSEFSKYITKTHEKQDQVILTYLSNILNRDGELNANNLLPIAHQGMMEGFLVVIYDENEVNIWDNSDSFDEMHKNMTPPFSKAQLHKLVYPINKDKQLFGYLSISRDYSQFFTPEDIGFQQSLYRGLLTVAIASILIALLFSYLIAGQMSAPIISIKKAANQLQEGRLNTRVKVKTQTREIMELVDSINHLGSSLERQETLRRRLTSDISHELRTPLNIIQSHLEALIDGIWEPTADRLKSCHAEALRLTNLVKELEKLTQLDDDQIQLKKDHIQLNQVLRDLVIQIQPKYYQKSLSLVLTENAAIDIVVDEDKIRQVFINLLMNSFKFTPDHGSVEIIITKDNKNAIIHIKDNGIGISEEDIPNIFERFYRSESSRNRDTGGAGLGLAIVQSIINAHGGRISVNSQKNIGTQFTIYLPLSIDD